MPLLFQTSAPGGSQSSNGASRSSPAEVQNTIRSAGAGAGSRWRTTWAAMISASAVGDRGGEGVRRVAETHHVARLVRARRGLVPLRGRHLEQRVAGVVLDVDAHDACIAARRGSVNRRLALTGAGRRAILRG